MVRVLAVIIASAVVLGGCAERDEPSASEDERSRDMDISVRSSAFDDGGMIPAKYTCDGQDVSPPLTWEGVPAGTKSVALISDDPDAPVGTWVHWVAWNIPAETRGLPEAVPTDPTLPDGMRQGISDFGRPGYGGPCPPGGVHRYYFKLYALDTMLELPDRTGKADLVTAMEGHVLGEGQLMGRYRRQ